MEDGVLDESAIERLREAFAAEHERTYGHRGGPDAPIDLVNLRLTAAGLSERPRVPSDGAQQAAPLQWGVQRTEPTRRPADRRAYFGPAGLLETPILDRSDLDGRPREGPLIVEEYDATTVVPPSCTAALDDWGNIVVEIGS
jgi:N-methylhydantoinase A